MSENKNNGSEVSATQRAADNMSGLAQDAITLAELQIALFKVDARESLGKSLGPLVLLAVAVVLTLGCVPIVLACLAIFLVESAGWSYGPAFLLTALVGMTAGALFGWLGWTKLCDMLAVFSRSRDELQRNLTWMKEHVVGPWDPLRRPPERPDFPASRHLQPGGHPAGRGSPE
jgi:hypothetical protein